MRLTETSTFHDVYKKRMLQFSTMNVNSDSKAVVRTKSFYILSFSRNLSLPNHLLSPVFPPLFTFPILLCFSLGLPLFINDGLVPTAEPMFCKAVEVASPCVYSWLHMPYWSLYFFPFSILSHFNSFVTVSCEKDLKAEDICYGQLISKKKKGRQHGLSVTGVTYSLQCSICEH